MEAAAAARFYYDRGWNPLPSRSDVKGPACQDYGRYRDGERIPAEWLEKWWGENIQLCLGVPWGLVAVDLDGPEARIRWHSWARKRGCPDTWTVRTGGGGFHLWFQVPAWTKGVPSRKVWGVWDRQQNQWFRHKFIEILGDGSLLIVPPSRHVDTALPYEFLDGMGPRELARPALCPGWVLDLPRLNPPLPPRRAGWHKERPIPRSIAPPTLPRDEILGRISPERKLDLARDAGLRVASCIPNRKGFLKCHSIYREDRHPSAGYHFESGVYWESGLKSLSYLDLLVELGLYRDWNEALAALEHY